MKIHVKLFASVRDICGYSDKELNLQAPVTVKELIQELFKNNPELTNKNNLLIAINEEYVSPEALIKDGDTVAIFPPVSGG